MKISQLVLGTTMLLTSTLALALEPQFSKAEQDYFSIASVKVTEVENALPEVSPCFLALKDCVQPSNTVKSEGKLPADPVGDVIAVGQNLWKLVEAGKPSAHIVANSVSALPKEDPNWNQMTGWQGPLIKAYHMEMLNVLGMKVISMDYKIMAYYGGKFQGVGSYITNLTMVTDKVEVTWGYDLQATAELMDLINTNTEANPIPGCTMQMKWKVDTMLAHREGTHSIFVKGDGTTKDLN